ncbi:MAG TPA: hypothetical protein VII06_09750 [Chloroflexota bacterium]|jgi:hypothetical protein
MTTTARIAPCGCIFDDAWQLQRPQCRAYLEADDPAQHVAQAVAAILTAPVSDAEIERGLARYLEHLTDDYRVAMGVGMRIGVRWRERHG